VGNVGARSNWEVDRGRHDLMRLRRHSAFQPENNLHLPKSVGLTIQRGSVIDVGGHGQKCMPEFHARRAHQPWSTRLLPHRAAPCGMVHMPEVIAGL
jgi:hypothetical protein